MSRTIETVPMLRRALAVLVGAEGVALTVAAVWVGVDALVNDDAGPMAAAVALMAAIVGLPLVWGSRALWLGASWPRGLVVTWQVIQIVVGFTLWEWSAVVALAAIAVAVAAGATALADARADARAEHSPDDDRTPPQAQ